MSLDLEQHVLSSLSQFKLTPSIYKAIMKKDIHFRVPLLAISTFLDSFEDIREFSPQLIVGMLGIPFHTAQYFLGMLCGIHTMDFGSEKI